MRNYRSSFISIASLFVPPIFIRFIKYLKRLNIIVSKSSPFSLESSIEITTKSRNGFFNDQVAESCFSCTSNIFYVHVDDLVYAGGISFTSDLHPFQAYYRGGLQSLKEFYDTHQPKDIFEKHFLETTLKPDLAKNPFPTLPWLHKPNKSHNTGEKGLGPKHGVQSHGPISKEKLNLEAQRLKLVRSSIQKLGYDNTFEGWPRGYFLIDDKQDSVHARFLVVGGKHRVAAMVNLGYLCIKASFQPMYPRAIFRSQSKFWPGVRNGTFQEEEALLLFDTYFDISN